MFWTVSAVTLTKTNINRMQLFVIKCKGNNRYKQDNETTNEQIRDEKRQDKKAKINTC